MEDYEKIPISCQEFIGELKIGWEGQNQDIPREDFHGDKLRNCWKIENLRLLDLRSVSSLMASQQATKVNYSHEWVDMVTKTKRSKYFENHTT